MKNERIIFLNNQPRAFSEGTVELINDDWVFFDKDTDEAFPLDCFLSCEIHVYDQHTWKKGFLVSTYLVKGQHWQYVLKDYDMVKIRKKLPYSFEQWLKELDDETFYQFITNLNGLGFSVYDIIYCHNHLSYLLSSKKYGVNFLVFDNTEKLVSIHHFFDYDLHRKDRFEFTINTGERTLLYGVKPPT